MAENWALSLHPQHWNAIVDGSKTFELRRRLPGIKPGDRVVVYVTRPVGMVAGWFVVGDVIRADTGTLWDAVRHGVASTPRDLFDAYFAGCASPAAIAVRDVAIMASPVRPWFHPPQGVVRCAGWPDVLEDRASPSAHVA